jgi:uncharacterized protein (TIGR02466 family)
MTQETSSSPIQWTSLQEAFVTPIFTGRVRNAESLNPRLLEEIYAYKAASEKGMSRSNQNGWHSDTDLFKRQEPGFRELVQAIQGAFTAITRKIAPEFDLSEASWAVDGWVNVSHRGAYNTPHDHAGFMWSGVYYVRVPATSHARSGQIEFLDPRTSVAGGSLQSNYFIPKIRKVPQAGELYMFPSYLRHWVYPNEEDEDRVSIAFNAGIRGAKVKKPAG